MAALPPDDILSHWSALIENFQASPLAFYQAVEDALLRREVPATQNSRVEYREAGLLSANREYLHIARDKIVFDICGAPFGTGFFISWWLGEERPRLHPILKVLAVFGMFLVTAFFLRMFGLLWGPAILAMAVAVTLALVDAQAREGEIDDGYVRALPLIGWLYERLFKPITYYRIDTMLMFQKAVHNAVLEVLDAMTTEKGLRMLSELERKPVMREFYERRR